MSPQPGTGDRACFDSSATVRVARRVVGGSLLCRAIGHGVRWIAGRPSRFRIAEISESARPQEERASEQLQLVLTESRFVGALSLLFLAPFVAWPETRVRRLIAPLVPLDVAARVCLVSWSVIAATVTHALLMAALGQPTAALGWSVRLGLLVMSGLALWRPATVAAAWTAWTVRASTTGRQHDA